MLVVKMLKKNKFSLIGSLGFLVTSAKFYNLFTVLLDLLSRYAGYLIYNYW
jgi:hypothetical protein